LWEQSDTESTEWEAFLAKWLEFYGTTPVTPKELVRDIESGEGIADAVPVSISDAVHGKGDSYSRVGYQFRSRLGKRYGRRGLRLERGPQKSHGNTWVVIEDPGETVDGCDSEPSTLHSVSSFSCSKTGLVEGCGRLNTLYAGPKGIIPKEEEIIPRDDGLGVENPPQPSTLHYSYVCQRPDCGSPVDLTEAGDHWRSAKYACACGHQGVVTRQDYDRWMGRDLAQSRMAGD
jgi:hypothetical protein